MDQSPIDGVSYHLLSSPNERQTKLLPEGALIGELMSMNISYAKRFENSYYRPDTKWAYVIMFDSSQEKKNYSELDERVPVLLYEIPLNVILPDLMKLLL